jgi:hypothetical protein
MAAGRLGKLLFFSRRRGKKKQQQHKKNFSPFQFIANFLYIFNKKKKKFYTFACFVPLPPHI